jgi:hypothetical protein
MMRAMEEEEPMSIRRSFLSISALERQGWVDVADVSCSQPSRCNKGQTLKRNCPLAFCGFQEGLPGSDWEASTYIEESPDRGHTQRCRDSGLC